MTTKQQGQKEKGEQKNHKITPLLTSQPINEIIYKPWFTPYMHPNLIQKHVQKNLTIND